MNQQYSPQLFRKILVPVVPDAPSDAPLRVARMMARPANIAVAGLVEVPENETLSAGALPARRLRQELGRIAESLGLRLLGRIRVSHNSWNELIKIIEELDADLLVLDADQLGSFHLTSGQAFRNPPCDIVLASGEFPVKPAGVTCALRGGPHAELALRVGLAIERSSGSRLTALHLASASGIPEADAAFKGVERVLQNLPDVRRQYVATDDAAKGLLDAAAQADILVLGATVQPSNGPISIGPVADSVIRQRGNGVLVVKTSRPLPANMASESAGHSAISVLVDKWFGENTFHASEFANARHLLEVKERQSLRISVALPALNEESTVGHVLDVIIKEFMQGIPLVDELVLIDSDSSDRTRAIATEMGVDVRVHQSVLPRLGSRRGKGGALWESLLLTTGDLVIWMDTDIVNIHPRFVYGLLGPLISHPEIQFVKGFYRRPLRVGDKFQAGGGGRVTELTARPLLNLFFPELSGIIQPLSGEYGGRRSALEQLPFSSGYGVEIGLLIDVFEHFGLGAIAQGALQELVHHNQPLESLSKMSFAIIQTVMRRIEKRYGIQMLEDVNKTMKLIRYGQHRLLLDVEEIAELERPPMLEVPEYTERHVAPST